MKTRKRGRPRREGGTHKRRCRDVRPKTLTIRYGSATVTAARKLREENAAIEADGLEFDRPKTRGECQGQARPCPWVSCPHHLFLEASNRSVRLNFPDLDVWDLNESCALDVADRGGAVRDDVAPIANLTRERVRQIEKKALRKVEQFVGFREHAPDDSPASRRRLKVIGE